jgi:two-component system response regulator FlrC
MRPEPFSPSSAEVQSARVLLCEDSATERTALAQFLRKAGFAVDEASDGSSALLHLRNRAVDLVLLDLNMPDTDGFDVLAYLQTHKPELPVILMSGMPPDMIQKSIPRLPERELPPLLLKPLNPEQLIEVVTLKLEGELPA